MPAPALQVQLVDETPNGERRAAFVLELASERVTARELIRRRIEHEVAAYNAKPAKLFQGLIQPGDTERVLNGYRLRSLRKLDPERQVEVALDAFASNGFFMLVDDRQVEALDEEVVLTRGSTVSFVRLLPLVGG